MRPVGDDVVAALVGEEGLEVDSLRCSSLVPSHAVDIKVDLPCQVFSQPLGGVLVICRVFLEHHEFAEDLRWNQVVL